jgi:hypothetical protein
LSEIVPLTASDIGARPDARALWPTGVPDALGALWAVWASPLSDALTVERVTVAAGTFRDSLNRESARRPRLTLTTAEGVTVQWGTYNAGDLPNEMTTPEKLWLLQELLRQRTIHPGLVLDVQTRVGGYGAGAD